MPPPAIAAFPCEPMTTRRLARDRDGTLRPMTFVPSHPPILLAPHPFARYPDNSRKSVRKARHDAGFSFAGAPLNHSEDWIRPRPYRTQWLFENLTHGVKQRGVIASLARAIDSVTRAIASVTCVTLSITSVIDAVASASHLTCSQSSSPVASATDAFTRVIDAFTRASQLTCFVILAT